MRTITKLKGLLIGLFTATLAFACVALMPKTAPAPVSAETTEFTTQDININSLFSMSGNGFLWFQLSDSDYGTTQSQDLRSADNGNNDRLNALNMLDYILWDGTALSAKNSSWTVSAQAYANLWGKAVPSFDLALTSPSDGTVITVKAGCQFPSVAYAKGESTLVYVTTEDRMFVFDSETYTWSRYYNEVDISDQIYFSSVYTYNDSYRFDFRVSTRIWNAGTMIYMGNNNRYLYSYVMVNGKTVEWLADSANVDDSSYTYTTFPASNGGGWAIPVWMIAGNTSNGNLFGVYIHKNYLESLLATEGALTISVKEGFYTKDNVNNYVAKSTVEMDVAAQAASLTLNDGLQMNYKIKLPEMSFAGVSYKTSITFMGETVEYTTANTDTSGRLVYAFDKITPQNMNEKLDIRFIATYNGETFMWNETTISVQEYCETLYATASGELKTLLVDVLNYGAAAQQYKGITENLVNANVDQQYATATAPTESDNVLAASQGDDVKFNAAVLTLEDKVTVTAKFTASNVDGLTAMVQLGNNTAVAADIVALGNGVYGIVFADVAATQYDEAIVFTVSDTNGVVAKCRYSVNTYAQRTWDDATAGALAKALWAYGVSASAYAALV